MPITTATTAVVAAAATAARASTSRQETVVPGAAVGVEGGFWRHLVWVFGKKRRELVDVVVTKHCALRNKWKGGN